MEKICDDQSVFVFGITNLRYKSGTQSKVWFSCFDTQDWHCKVQNN